jgi:type IV pilus assembly protein PilW
VGALKAALPLHVQGYDAAAAKPSCLTDVKSGTDVLVVRHTRACVTGDPNCDASDPDGPLFQASLCNNPSELGSGNPADHYALDTDAAALTRHARDCNQTAGSGSLAPVRRFLTHIYFVASNDNSGDGIPTLKRAELRLVDGNLQFVIVPLVEGIDTLQLEYGMDTDGNGVVDAYSATPDGANGCAAPGCAATNWRNVLSVRVALLAKNTDSATGVKSQPFQTTVLMANPTGRKLP